MTPLPLESIVIRDGQQWRAGAVMLTDGERYYQLIAVNDTYNIALLPWFEVEPWAVIEPIVRSDR